MAWQTPKVDWAPEDGVLDADFNRIEGNINFLKGVSDRVTPNILTDDVTIYVSPSGNDDTGTGASNMPFRTITKALSVVPKNLSGRSVIINVSAGTYNESLTIEGFDTPITLTGTIGAAVTVSGVRVAGCTCFVENIRIISDIAVFVTNGGRLVGDIDLTVNGRAITVNYGGHLVISNAIVNNVSAYAIEVNRGGVFHATTVSGNGNTNGIRCQSGGVASLGTNSMLVSGTQYNSLTGGRIYTGSQQPGTGSGGL